MISEQHVYISFYVCAAEAPPVGLLKLEKQGIFESGDFVYGKNYLQDERAIAIHPEIFPLRTDSFQLPQKSLVQKYRATTPHHLGAITICH